MAQLPSGYVRLQDSVRTPVTGATDVGAADPASIVWVTVRLRRRPDSPPLPSIEARTSREAPLTREAFATTYGASGDDIDAVRAFAAAHGLQVEKVDVGARTVELSGTADAIGEAFFVELRTYRAGGSEYRGRIGHVHLPRALATVVEGVFGLDDRPQATPAFTAAAAGADVHPMRPQDVARLYGFPSGDASGQCIGLLEFDGGYDPSDVDLWFTTAGIPTPTLKDVGVDGAVNTPGSSADVEVLLDIDVAGSAAPGATIAVYFTTWTEKGWVDAVTTAVHDAVNAPSVLSISWGWPEREDAEGLRWTTAAMKAVSETFHEAGLLGVTVLVASGDDGTDCKIGDRHAHVLYPAADPYATACGGTELRDVQADGTFTEVLWTSADEGASGGGISTAFPVPAWQAGITLPADANGTARRGRGTPDIAGNAHPASGYTLIQNGKAIGPIGGTSAVAPLYAGLIALCNAADPTRPAGYLNPFLYSGPAIFRDTDSAGTNGYNGAPGYPVTAGWDATTGFGSVDGTALKNAR